jgi:hypothetical protein
VYTKSGVALYAFPGTKPNVLRRTLRRLGGQIILLAFVLLDTGSLGFALVAPVWLAPWVTINLTALMLGTLSWSENRRMQREIATAMQRQRRGERKQEAQLQADWWSVLGVAPSANKDDIVRNFRRRIKQCHPDRVVGLAPEFLELAEEHTKELNEAYENAMRCRRGPALS